MSWLVRALYNLLLPVFCLVAAPAWILRAAKRGGLGPKLWERLGCYDRAPEFEPGGGIYLHAVSVGEVVMALKLINRWRDRDPEERFVLAATTSTGFRLAQDEAAEGVRVIYSPVDFPLLITRLFRRFEPRLIVLVDSELWPNLLHQADRRGVPVALVNARLSPRSARRYQKFAAVTKPILGRLKLVCAQAEEHAGTWEAIGIPKDRLEVTGSVKFDQVGAPASKKRDEFHGMLDSFGAGRPVVLGASTHTGEESLIARAVSKTAGALPVVLPRHAERGEEVKEGLELSGFEVALRSSFETPSDRSRAVFVVDSTGELRDWTAHADLVVIGKSFLAKGGQNPCEAIAAGVPVICGPQMGNFEPLITQLREAGGVRSVTDGSELAAAIEDLLGRAKERKAMTGKAAMVLARHRGATDRTLDLLTDLAER